jgi:hypothetical protein
MSDDDLMAKVRWAENRAWLRYEMSAHEGVAEDYSRGYLMAMMKVYGRMFLTDEEKRDVEEARREMFG